MTTAEVAAKINARLIEAEMYHSQMAEYWDFFGYLNGFKRQQEYQLMKEVYARRKLNRWYINHYNELIPEIAVTDPSAIPPAFYTMIRPNLNGNSKGFIKSGIESWYTWEADTLKIFNDLIDEVDDHCMHAYLNKLIKGIYEEIADVTRVWLRCKALDYDVTEMTNMQNCIHKKYKHKMKRFCWA